MRRTLSAREPENPEEKEIALSLRMWVPLTLESTAEPNEIIPLLPSFGGRSGAVLAIS